MKAYTRRRLIASAKLGLAAIPFSVAIRLAHGFGLQPGGVILGFGAGFMVGVVELFLIRDWFRNLPFLAHLALKSLSIVAVIYVTFGVLNLLDVAIDGITWQAYFGVMTEPGTILGLAEALAVIAFLLFFVQLDRLLGPGLLLGYVTGRYHRPRHEQRVFMFLDLKGSTTLGEEMEPDAYFGFLQEYFAAMSEAILESNAEIYQYVGDEVVLTWQLAQGIEEANCVRVFFKIRALIEGRREFFLQQYGVMPEFKAGLHAGEVITAQIGDIKRELVYNGDVLNTTARIQSTCNALGRTLLVSGALLEMLELDASFRTEALGAVELKGKEEPVDLHAIELAEQVGRT